MATYVPPPLSDPIVFPAGSYTPPSLSDPVVIDEYYVDATLSASFPALSALTPTLAAQVTTVVPATLSVSFPALSAPSASLAATVAVTSIATATIAIDLPPPAPALAVALVVALDLDLPDANGTSSGLESRSACPAGGGIVAYQQAMRLGDAAVQERQASAMPQGLAILAPRAEMIRVGGTVLASAASTLHAGASVSAPCVDMARRGAADRLPMASALPAETRATLRVSDAARRFSSVMARQQSAAQTVVEAQFPRWNAWLTANRLAVRQQEMIPPDPGYSWPRYVPPPLSDPVVLDGAAYTPPPICCPVLLSWGAVPQPPCDCQDRPATVVIPILRAYCVLSSFSLERADTGQRVIAPDFSQSIDADSWCWAWSATVPASQESLVRPAGPGEYVTLIATVNGAPVRCVVEKLSRSRKFGEETLRISGRGMAYALAEPVSPVVTVMNTAPRTAQQLLGDALTLNGVPLGWTVDWRIEDWTVPAGAWSYTGTYMGAAIRIAEAGGGYVQADPTEMTLHVFPYYPVYPWNWASATPDVVIPEDVALVEEMEWTEKPGYNAVWIVGGAGGRRDQIVRAGSAADWSAPTVIDPLATDPVMTRQRGGRVLADAGSQVTLSLKLPVLQASGIIPPGKLIRYTEQGNTHVGLSRAVSVQVSFPEIWQTIKVETHVESV